MSRVNHERLCRKTGTSRVLAEIESVARDLTGGELIILLRRGDEILEVQPNGREAVLPAFCDVYRTTKESRRRCMTCRSLMTFAACYRGMVDFTCHGGVSIIAAAVPAELCDGARPVVVSCAFATENRMEGWRRTRDHARDLGVDLKDLRRAYDRLPQLTEERRLVTRAFVNIAACAIGEIVDRAAQSPAEEGKSEYIQHGISEKTDIEDMIGATLFISRDDSPSTNGNSNGVRFVQLVKDMVNRSPDMPFSVENIARAARISPNHFSTVFRKHAGQTFSTFLAEKRIGLAKNLLRDLTLNVSEVAARTGFRDNSYFIRRFKQKTGMTPMGWRHSL